MSSHTAPFRVHSPVTDTDLNRQHRGRRDVVTPPTQMGNTVEARDGDPFLTRLVKLIPAEIIAIYLAGNELAEEFPGWWAFICLLLVLISRIWGTKEGKNVQWIAVIVSAISFVIWVYAMGNFFFNLKLPNYYTGVPSLAVLVWTFLVPYFYKGDQQ